MTPQELKNSILQLAIQGKLVEQRPEEGTAEELYAQIQAEKQALIKAGKIKKEKPLPEIAEDEKPFDIPDSWKWVRITELGSFVAGYTPKADELSDVGTIPYFKVSDMNTPGNEMFLHISTNFLKDSNPHNIYLKNTIVYPKNGGAVFTNKKRILAQDSVVDLNTGGFTVVGPVDLMYYYTFFSMIDFKQCYKGTALPTIDMDKLRGKWFPLPPLAEQKRIVSKIEELLPLIDRYEEAWTKLEEFNKRFPGDMQKSLLQMAIQGKLVEQRPEEGTGEELYAQIQAEKQALIKSGKIKKDKPLPEITDDEKPFDIPESWKWVRLGDCSSYAQSKTKISPSEITSEMWSLDLEDIEKETGRIHTFCKAEDRKITGEKVCFSKGQVLYSKLRPYLKKILVAPADGICTPELVPFSVYGQVDSEYVANVLRAPHVDFVINAVTYGVKMPRVGTDTMVNLLVPLPPLAEQKRIVAKLEELLPLCERLK